MLFTVLYANVLLYIRYIEEITLWMCEIQHCFCLFC